MHLPLGHAGKLGMSMGPHCCLGQCMTEKITCLVLIHNGQCTATCVVTCIGVDIVMPVKSVTRRFRSATPFLRCKNVIWIWWCISQSSQIWQWHCLNSAAHDNMCSAICLQSEGPCCIGLAINLTMHPPLRKRLSFHNGHREPVYAILCVEVAVWLLISTKEKCMLAPSRSIAMTMVRVVHMLNLGCIYCVAMHKNDLWHSDAGAIWWYWWRTNFPKACETKRGEDPATNFDVMPRFICSARPNKKINSGLVDHHRWLHCLVGAFLFDMIPAKHLLTTSFEVKSWFICSACSTGRSIQRW